MLGGVLVHNTPWSTGVACTVKLFAAVASRTFLLIAALSQDLDGSKPLGVDILGMRVALFRDAATGQVQCIDDTCPHRWVHLPTPGRWPREGTGAWVRGCQQVRMAPRTSQQRGLGYRGPPQVGARASHIRQPGLHVTKRCDFGALECLA
jgi:hypothetical protein